MVFSLNLLYAFAFGAVMQHNHSQDSVDYFDEIQLLNIHLKQNLIDVKINLAFKHEHKPVWEPLYEQYFEKKQIKRSFCRNSKQISQSPFLWCFDTYKKKRNICLHQEQMWVLQVKIAKQYIKIYW